MTNRDDAAADGSIDITLPLRHDLGATLRLVVASLAADAAFSVDEIDDLRLGVSEVFASLTEHADPSARCTASIDVEPRRVAISLRHDGAAGPIELDPLASTILASVVDEVIADETGITLVKHAVESS